MQFKKKIIVFVGKSIKEIIIRIQNFRELHKKKIFISKFLRMKEYQFIKTKLINKINIQKIYFKVNKNISL